MNPTLILTHPGSAHADDLLACAMISSLHSGLPIERRAATDAELADPSVAVLDEGMRWEPALSNFDHHQDDPRVRGRCTVSLLLEHVLDCTPEALPEQVSWLPHFETWDALGPGALGRSFGLDMSQTLALQYDITGPLLRDLFAAESRIEPDSALGVILQALGNRLLADIQQRRDDFNMLDQRMESITAAGLPGLILDPLPGETDLPRFLKDWIASRHPGAAFYITLNRRGGTSLTRWGDAPPIDFRKLEGHSDVRFIHPSGFMAVTDLPVREAVALVAAAKRT
jgi:hypothetical protein